jgi:glucokinase
MRSVSVRCVIGIDLGGTNVRAAAIADDGTALTERFTVPSRAREGLDATLAAITETVRRAIECAPSRPLAIGMAVPGHIDDSKGEVRWAPNFGSEESGVFRYWEHVQLRAPLEEQLGLPVRLGNDANLAALGEYRYGEGAGGAAGLVLFTLGTGVGAGVVLRSDGLLGKASGDLLLLGGNLGGGELGHMVVDYGGIECPSGEYGSVEGYCQRDSVVRRAQTKLRRGRASMLDSMTSGDWSRITPRTISEAAEQGDEVAIETWAEVGLYLGVAIGNAINVFAPEVVAIGGQMAKAGRFLLDPARHSARNVAIPSLFAFARIVQAIHLEDAGILGAAALAWRSLE